jgi:methionine synthase I (cobalamin-dependent)
MSLFDLFLSGKTILIAGARGAMLRERGTPFNHCFHELDLTGLEVVTGVHRECHKAGVKFVLTNTFSANHDLSVQVAQCLHRHVRHELGLPEGQGKRYSWGYPAIPELEDHR